MVSRFVLLFEGRTGSRHTIEALNSHPQVVAQLEWLNRRPHESQPDDLAAFFTAAYPAGVRAVGLKAKLHRLGQKDRIADVLRGHHARIIHSQRQNFVKHAVSNINARRLYDDRGKWNLRKGEQPLGAFRVDPAELERTIVRQREHNERLSAYVATLGLPTLEVWYEDLLADEPGYFARIFEFLSVDSRPVGSAVAKNTSDDLAVVLTNYDELRDAFRGTAYAGMF